MNTLHREAVSSLLPVAAPCSPAPPPMRSDTRRSAGSAVAVRVRYIRQRLWRPGHRLIAASVARSRRGASKRRNSARQQAASRVASDLSGPLAHHTDRGRAAFLVVPQPVTAESPQASTANAESGLTARPSNDAYEHQARALEERGGPVPGSGVGATSARKEDATRARRRRQLCRRACFAHGRVRRD